MAERDSFIDTERLGEVARLFTPDLVEHRGGVFRAVALEATRVDDWFESLDGDVARIEAVVNHVHLFDFVTDHFDSDQPPELWAIALRLADAWRALLAARFPDRRFEVSAAVGYGPEVTFWQTPTS